MSAFRSTTRLATAAAAARPACRSQAQLQTNISRSARRSYATHEPDHPPANIGGGPGLAPMYIGLALAIPGAFWLISSGQKDTQHNDHQGQKSIHTDNKSMIEGSTPRIDESELKASKHDSDLPEDAPNHPRNLERTQKKMDSKPPTKMIAPKSRSNLKDE